MPLLHTLGTAAQSSRGGRGGVEGWGVVRPCAAFPPHASQLFQPPHPHSDARELTKSGRNAAGDLQHRMGRPRGAEGHRRREHCCPLWDGVTEMSPWGQSPARPRFPSPSLPQSNDLLWDDYEAKLGDQALRLMENYLAQFGDIKACGV